MKKDQLDHPIKLAFLFLQVLAHALSQDKRYRCLLQAYLVINAGEEMTFSEDFWRKITSPSGSASTSVASSAAPEEEEDEKEVHISFISLTSSIY